MSRPQVLQNLREALVNNRAMAIELLADVLIQQGFVQASALFTAANGVAIAPGVWAAAIAQIAETPEGAVIRNVLQNRHHCHLMGVSPEPGEAVPPFTYSIGLWYNFQHPEIICIGLPNQVAGELINTYAKDVAEGHPPCLDTAITGALANDYQLQFKRCSDRAKTEYTCWASWFNGSIDYAVIQLVWQDKQYRWPWDVDFRPQAAQPLLFE
jgi:Domain of unknown function (DUF4262)